MKLIMENWRHYINEEEEKGAVSLFLLTLASGLAVDMTREMILATTGAGSRKLAYKAFEEFWEDPDLITKGEFHSGLRKHLYNLVVKPKLKIAIKELDRDPLSEMQIEHFKEAIKTEINATEGIRAPFLINVNHILQDVVDEEHNRIAAEQQAILDATPPAPEAEMAIAAQE